MRKIFFLILIIGVLSALGAYKVNAQLTGWFIKGESVQPNNIHIGETVLLSFDVTSISFSPQECADPRVYFYDGGSTDGEVLTRCCRGPLGSEQGANCHYEVIHTYENAGDYGVSISLRGGGVGFAGLGVDLGSASVSLSVTTPPQPPTPVTGFNPLRITSISELIEFSAGFIFWLGTAILVIMIVVGGFTVLTSAGDPSRVTRGRNILFYSLLGFAIMTLARGIIELIYLALGIR